MNDLQDVIRLSQNEIVFDEGDAGSHMYFIHGGKIQIEKKMGETYKLLAILEKGDFFGEMALFDDNLRSARARVVEDAKLLRVDSSNFEKLMTGNIEIAVRMIRKYIARLKESNAQLEKQILFSQKISSTVNPEPPAAKKAAEVGFLIAEKSNVAYPLEEKAVLSVGRFDPVTKISPDIDLTSEDPEKSISRKHAIIENVSGDLLISEQMGVSNGTYVDQNRLEPGQKIKLNDGTRLSIGFVEFRFSKEQ